jgi:hypothetical protein
MTPNLSAYAGLSPRMGGDRVPENNGAQSRKPSTPRRPGMGLRAAEGTLMVMCWEFGS